MISQGGGSQPLWRRDGKELFYISADTKVMAVPVSTAPTFQRLGAPMALFTAPIYGGGRYNTHRWAAMPNGQKFIINSVLHGSGVGTDHRDHKLEGVAEQVTAKNESESANSSVGHPEVIHFIRHAEPPAD